MNDTKKIQELNEKDLKKVAGGRRIIYIKDGINPKKQICENGCEALSPNECVAAGRSYDQSTKCCC